MACITSPCRSATDLSRTTDTCRRDCRDLQGRSRARQVSGCDRRPGMRRRARGPVEVPPPAAWPGDRRAASPAGLTSITSLETVQSGPGDVFVCRHVYKDTVSSLPGRAEQPTVAREDPQIPRDTHGGPPRADAMTRRSRDRGAHGASRAMRISPLALLPRVRSGCRRSSQLARRRAIERPRALRPHVHRRFVLRECASSSWPSAKRPRWIR